MIIVFKIVGICIAAAIAVYTFRVCRQDEREKNDKRRD